jgi:NAD(P)H-hydrate epimerase
MIAIDRDRIDTFKEAEASRTQAYIMSGPRSQLPDRLYRGEQVRELDRVASTRAGIPGPVLMERAGTAVFTVLRARWTTRSRIAVVCGPGNNGGDGFVTARLAHAAGYPVQVHLIGERIRLRGDALTMAQAWESTGGGIEAFTDGCLTEAEIIVDALLGTGLDREVSGVWLQAVEAMNRSQAPVVAVDIPSGLHADTGRALGAAVQARVTVTFVGLKQGLFTGQAADHCGELLFDDLGVPAAVYEGMTPSALRLGWQELRQLLPRRARSAHKGRFGHVLIVGGDHGMSGAARMAGEAAARVGAGLVSIATRPRHAALLSVARPELMCHGVAVADRLEPLLWSQSGPASVARPGPGRCSTGYSAAATRWWWTPMPSTCLPRHRLPAATGF